MNTKKIIAHLVMRNEEIWVWYAIMSVIDFVDEILIWDTGSIDHSVEIIKLISNPKISFRQCKVTLSETDLSEVRNEMLKHSMDYDWMMILDADEVWLESSLKSTVQFIETNAQNYDSIVVPTLNCVGDVFHVSPPSAGRYQLAGKIGHYNLRFINLKIPDLHVSNPEGKLQSYLDKDNLPLQNRDSSRIQFLDAPYLHMTHLVRSTNREDEKSVFWRSEKRKYDFGVPLPKSFAYPKCFYLPHSLLVPSAFESRSWEFTLQAVWQTPLRRARNIFKHA